MQRLKVSTNHRYLATADGAPVFYLGDTAWNLFHRLTLEEATHYLQDRAAKRFTVIQAVLLPEDIAFAERDANGDEALLGADPLRPNEAHFAHVDRVLSVAESLGLYVGVVPTWGSYVSDPGSIIFEPQTMRSFGNYLGQRYARRDNLFWIVGGDRHPVWHGIDYRPAWRALAEGLRAGDEWGHLTTFHPRGDGHSSSIWFHDDPWLDFNMMQSGPRRNLPNYATIARDYAMLPTKPAMDGEPGYERAHPHINPANGRLSAHDARKYAYWALFAGAHGHTYGALEVWQMYAPGRPAKNGAELHWRDALDLPGAAQMRHVRALMESRPFFDRIPDQDLIVSPHGEAETRVQGTRAEDGSCAMVYITSGDPVELDLGRLAGSHARVSWFDPRTGRSDPAAIVPATGARTFRPPSSGPGQDWVLVLDQAD